MGISFADSSGRCSFLACSAPPLDFRATDSAGRGESTSMIQPLRKLHRSVFLAWTAILPAVFLGGVLSRPRWPKPANAKEAGPGKLLVWEKTESLRNHPTRIRLLRDQTDKESLSVQFAPENPLVAPDVLVYWVSHPSPADLPSDARLLGSFRPLQVYELPKEAMNRGHVMLYSLALRESLGSIALGAQP
jgi:hypothetical protein